MIEYDSTKKLLRSKDSQIRHLLSEQIQHCIIATDPSGTSAVGGSGVKELAKLLKKEPSSGDSEDSSPVHLYPMLENERTPSEKTSLETSEFEKICESAGKGTPTSVENSDLEVIETKSDLEDH
ncbi:unnamed protein product [Anisakis simplex]|uniref:Uncharacterized protein n=1 Tax=Anisakis simplex TaxID=6269 RepID=A0A3P6ST81_ANISI|nr:unnamed protein product [Anisakis simplex]